MIPTLALAHENETKLGVGAGLNVRIEKGIERAEKHDEKKDHRDEKHEDRKVKQATTTAAAITKQGVRIQAAADTVLSFNARMSALIASSSADTKAALEAKFATYTTAAANAKVEAGKAITAAAQINASNSTTTNATLITTAKVDLKEAKGFLHDAKEAFFSILRTLWK